MTMENTKVLSYGDETSCGIQVFGIPIKIMFPQKTNRGIHFSETCAMYLRSFHTDVCQVAKVIRFDIYGE